MIIRSAKVPLSPSSALQTTYFCAASVWRTVSHLMPVGNPAPPRPRRPLSVTSLVMSALLMPSARRNPAHPPCASYAARSKGSITPQRAKVRRVCCAKYGISSVAPWLANVPPNRSDTSSGVTGPKAIRVPSTSISIKGSSQIIPRVPVRINVMFSLRALACAKIASATASAPRALAALSAER